jgi:hypothetical protein
VNSNIFARIFRYSTTHIDLKNILEFKEFKDLKLRKLMNLTFLEHPKKIPRRSREDTRSCIIVVSRVKHFEKIEMFGDVVN